MSDLLGTLPFPTAVAVSVALCAGGYAGYSRGYAAASAAAQRTPALTERPRVMLFGDSITQYSFDPKESGWGAGLANWYSRHADILNRGFSGFNSRQGLVLLRRLLPLGGPSQPRLLTIKFGANDAADSTLNPGQHVPLAEYESNLRAMVEHTTSACPGVQIVLITPPPVDEAGILANSLAKGWLKEGEPIDRTVAGVRPYAEAARRVGSSLSLPVVDLWEGPNAIGSDPADFVDGLHLAESGNKKLLMALQRVINTHFSAAGKAPLLLPCGEEQGGMPMHFPHWSVAAPDVIHKWTWPPLPAAD